MPPTLPLWLTNDIATYPHLFGNISAELTSLVGKRELNYVIPNAQALSNAPANAEYLVFTEEINLPTNWTATSTEKGIEVKDNTGEVIYLYPKPVSTDANLTLRQEENTIYEMQQNGSVLTLKTKVKTEWLLSTERVFPVKVDPTTSATANGGRSVYNDGDEETLGYYGWVSGYWLQYHVKFNTSSIPSGSTVDAVVGYFTYGEQQELGIPQVNGLGLILPIRQRLQELPYTIVLQLCNQQA